jgi:hypothetical protein
VKLLDALGWAKWPSVLLISVLPLVAYFATWRQSMAPSAPLYGPRETALGSVVLLRDERSGALWNQRHDWQLRPCDGCTARLREASMAYGNAGGPMPTQWMPVGNSYGALRASLPLHASEAPDVWLRLELVDGRRVMLAWTWDGKTRALP